MYAREVSESKRHVAPTFLSTLYAGTFLGHDGELLVHEMIVMVGPSFYNTAHRDIAVVKLSQGRRLAHAREMCGTNLFISFA